MRSSFSCVACMSARCYFRRWTLSHFTSCFQQKFNTNFLFMIPIVCKKIIQSRCQYRFNWIPRILDKPMAGILILRTLKEQEMQTFISTLAKEWPWRCPKINFHMCLPHARGWKKQRNPIAA